MCCNPRVAPAAFLPSIGWLTPFVGLLIALAIVPMAAPAFWASNRRKLAVSALFGLPVLALYLQYDAPAVGDMARDYVSFVVLLGSLFLVSAGVVLTGDVAATPKTNTCLLAVGAALASIIGTTGASMLLVRPLLRINGERRRVTHTVVFFIFLVSNIGGCLTPLGDPPLFLGYLRGVPFAWTLRLAPAWLFTTTILLAVYAIWDWRAYRSERPADLAADRATIGPLRLRGAHNLVLLGGIVVVGAILPNPWRELAMVVLTAASYIRTPAELRAANHFSIEPIVEVAVIFAGIFATILPALAILQAHGAALGVTTPRQFFWTTGALSSFLDNAPTYVAMLAVAQGLRLAPDVAGVPHDILIAISLGAVFMGALSYIGNGPNFMVRSIAEQRGVRMPTFAGYLLYSGAVLLPVFALVTIVFLPG